MYEINSKRLRHTERTAYCCDFLTWGIAAFQIGHSELRRHAINHREVIIIGSDRPSKDSQDGGGDLCSGC